MSVHFEEKLVTFVPKLPQNHPKSAPNAGATLIHAPTRGVWRYCLEPENIGL